MFTYIVMLVQPHALAAKTMSLTRCFLLTFNSSLAVTLQCSVPLAVFCLGAVLPSTIGGLHLALLLQDLTGRRCARRRPTGLGPASKIVVPLPNLKILLQGL